MIRHPVRTRAGRHDARAFVDAEDELRCRRERDVDRAADERRHDRDRIERDELHVQPFARKEPARFGDEVRPVLRRYGRGREANHRFGGRIRRGAYGEKGDRGHGAGNDASMNAMSVVHIVRAIVAAMNRLHNKTALITGGNSGIGLATARMFLAEGAQVALTGRNRETLAAAERELGPDALVIAADATHPGAPDEAVARTIERFGKLDIVFANAGIVGQTPLGSTTAEAFERILSINLTAVFLTVQAALPHLPAGGAIILNGSVHAEVGNPNMSAYAASKGGVRAMTRVLAAELAPRGIRVNVVIPGPTRTPIRSSRVASPEALAALEANIMRSVPLNDLGEADDIAYAVVYLASDEARHVTAAEIVVDGGTSGTPGGAPIYRR